MLSIRYHRQKLGLSQRVLGTAVGISQPSVCAIELGKICPTDQLLDRIADVLGVEPAFALLRPVVVSEEPTIELQRDRTLQTGDARGVAR